MVLWLACAEEVGRAVREAPERSPTGEGCAPPPPAGVVFLDDLPTGEELAFDADGHVISVDGGLVLATPRDGPPEVRWPYESEEVGGLRFAPDGALALADEALGAVVRLDWATGAVSPLAGGLDSPNSIGFDDQGRLYVAAFGALSRVDPDDDDPPEVLVELPGADLDGVTFSPSFDRVYFDTDEGRTVGAVDTADGTVETVAQLATEAALDGMATDACGNLYVVSLAGEITRIRTDGTVEPWFRVERPGGVFTTALAFGSGAGGWARDRLYVMDRGHGLVELEAGVDGRPEVHLLP